MSTGSRENWPGMHPNGLDVAWQKRPASDVWLFPRHDVATDSNQLVKWSEVNPLDGMSHSPRHMPQRTRQCYDQRKALQHIGHLP